MARFALGKEQRKYFEENNFLELEGVFPPQKVVEANQAVDMGLSRRLDLSPQYLSIATNDELWRAGRDLWRDSLILKRLVCSRKVALLLAELLSTSYLRLGCDQLLTGTQLAEMGDCSIQEKICFQGVVGGLLVCLKGAEALPSPFPRHEGNVTVFTGDDRVPFGLLGLHPEARFLLIVYCQNNAVYIANSRDPSGHWLKRLGYVFGDRLRDELNPVLCSAV